MNSETETGLVASKAFLTDSIELAHLRIKQQLERLRAGDEIDWKEAGALMKEGRSSARQLTQIASLEVRDRALALKKRKHAPKQPAKPRPEQTPKKPPQPGDRQKLYELSSNWIEAIAEANRDPGATPMPEFPQELVAMIEDYGLDPGREDSLDLLAAWLFKDAAPVASAA